MLSRSFDLHFNVEFNNSVKFIKFICKYDSKVPMSPLLQPTSQTMKQPHIRMQVPENQYGSLENTRLSNKQTGSVCSWFLVSSLEHGKRIVFSVYKQLFILHWWHQRRLFQLFSMFFKRALSPELFFIRRLQPTTHRKLWQRRKRCWLNQVKNENKCKKSSHDTSYLH